MSQINSVNIGGNLTKDPDVFVSEKNGTTVARLRLASNRIYGSGDERQEQTTFVDCVCFGRTGEVAAEYLKKGSAVSVTGRLATNSWTAEDGTPRSKLEVHVGELHLGARPQGQDGMAATTVAGEDDEGGVPF